MVQKFFANRATFLPGGIMAALTTSQSLSRFARTSQDVGLYASSENIDIRCVLRDHLRKLCVNCFELCGLRVGWAAMKDVANKTRQTFKQNPPN